MDFETTVIYDSSERSADLYYASGFLAPDPFLYIRHKGKAAIFVSELEYSRASRHATCKVLPMPRAPPAPNSTNKNGKSSIIAGMLRKMRVRKIAVPFDFPTGLAQRLEANGVRVEAANRTPFLSARRVKSEREIRLIAKSQEYAQRAIERAIALVSAAKIADDNKLIADGKTLTSERLQEEICAFLSSNGFDPDSPIASCGAQSALPHERGSGPLKAHQPIVLDVFPRHRTTRYWGDVTRTVVRGEPSKKLEEQYAAVLAAQENALSKVRAGTSGDEVHREVLAEFERRGFCRVTTKKGVFGFTHGTGHSVGLDLHEEPRISTGGATLEAGNAVTIEPGLYYPTTGGVRIEDLVIVRKNNCQNLTRLGKEDWIL